MKKGIKARIYLTKEQIDFIHKQLGCCRFVYNHCLDYKKSLYEKNNISLSSSETINHIVELKSKYPFLKDVHSKVLQQSVRDLNQAYINFLKIIKVILNLNPNMIQNKPVDFQKML